VVWMPQNDNEVNRKKISKGKKTFRSGGSSRDEVGGEREKVFAREGEWEKGWTKGGGSP